jgi:hypothetical protein
MPSDIFVPSDMVNGAKDGQKVVVRILEWPAKARSPIGEIVERRRDLFEKNKIYVCHSCFFFCDAKEEMTQTHMTESEIEKGFHLEWATAQEIINGNEPFCATQPWSFRDREFVKMLVEKKILTT